MNVPPEDTPAPESLNTLRGYADSLRLLLGFDTITIRHHVDMAVLVDFIRTHGWNGVVEVETRCQTLGVLASAEFAILGVEYVIFELQ